MRHTTSRQFWSLQADNFGAGVCYPIRERGFHVLSTSMVTICHREECFSLFTQLHVATFSIQLCWRTSPRTGSFIIQLFFWERGLGPSATALLQGSASPFSFVFFFFRISLAGARRRAVCVFDKIVMRLRVFGMLEGPDAES